MIELLDISGEGIFNTLDILLWIGNVIFWWLFFKTVGKTVLRSTKSD